MSNYKIGEKDDWDFRLIKRSGRVEMWHKPETHSYKVALYEHINQAEDCLFHSTKFELHLAEKVYETAVRVVNQSRAEPF